MIALTRHVEHHAAESSAVIKVERLQPSVELALWPERSVY